MKVCVAFYYFDLERNYDVLSLEMESKMENPTHTFGEMNLVLQRIANLKWNCDDLAKEKRVLFL